MTLSHLNSCIQLVYQYLLTNIQITGNKLLSQRINRSKEEKKKKKESYTPTISSSLTLFIYFYLFFLCLILNIIFFFIIVITASSFSYVFTVVVVVVNHIYEMARPPLTAITYWFDCRWSLSLKTVFNSLMMKTTESIYLFLFFFLAMIFKYGAKLLQRFLIVYFYIFLTTLVQFTNKLNNKKRYKYTLFKSVRQTIVLPDIRGYVMLM